MTRRVLTLGYVPLLDAAPLIVADALGFAEEEGQSLQLLPAPSWSALRDMLAQEQVTAAQMLAPLPIAMALGLCPGPARFEALSVLNANGDVIGVRTCGRRIARCGLCLRLCLGHGCRRRIGAHRMDRSPAHRGADPVFDACRTGALLTWGGWRATAVRLRHSHRTAAPDGAGAGRRRDRRLFGRRTLGGRWRWNGVSAPCFCPSRRSGNLRRKKSLRRGRAGPRRIRTWPGRCCARCGGQGGGWAARQTG